MHLSKTSARQQRHRLHTAGMQNIMRVLQAPPDALIHLQASLSCTSATKHTQHATVGGNIMVGPDGTQLHTTSGCRRKAYASPHRHSGVHTMHGISNQACCLLKHAPAPDCKPPTALHYHDTQQPLTATNCNCKTCVCGVSRQTYHAKLLCRIQHRCCVTQHKVHARGSRNATQQ